MKGWAGGERDEPEIPTSGGSSRPPYRDVTGAPHGELGHSGTRPDEHGPQSLAHVREDCGREDHAQASTSHATEVVASVSSMRQSGRGGPPHVERRSVLQVTRAPRVGASGKKELRTRVMPLLARYRKRSGPSQCRAKVH